MTSCLSFARSSRCEFVSKALRLFNSQRSGFEFFLLPSRVHARPSAMRPQTQTVRPLSYEKGDL